MVKVWELLFANALGLGVPVALVTAETATGLVVVQVRSLVQLYELAGIEQDVREGVRVPDIVAHTAGAVAETALEYVDEPEAFVALTV